MCENSFCQQANLERHIKRHQQKFLNQNRDIRTAGLFENIATGSSADSGSTTSQTNPAMNEEFSEEEDEIVDLETISP